MELTQLGSTTEVQSSDSQVAWPLKQKDTSNGNYYGSMVRSEGIWPSSPRVDVSLNLYQDSAGDNKAGSARSVLSGYGSPISSRPNNQAEKGMKSEASVGCRLFGINLTSHSTSPSHPERESACSLMTSSSDKGCIPAAAPDADKTHNQEVSKLTMDQKTISEVPLKDTQSKQGSTLSSRSRTKVNFYWLVVFKIAPPFQAGPLLLMINLVFEKVQMQGVAVGRAVDLTTLGGYNDLIDELEKMFEIKGELRPPSKWAIVFTDDENDKMLVGDDLWT